MSYCGLFFFTRSIGGGGGRSNDSYNQTNYYKTRVIKIKNIITFRSIRFTPKTEKNMALL